MHAMSNRKRSAGEAGLEQVSSSEEEQPEVQGPAKRTRSSGVPVVKGII